MYDGRYSFTDMEEICDSLLKSSFLELTKSQYFKKSFIFFETDFHLEADVMHCIISLYIKFYY